MRLMPVISTAGLLVLLVWIPATARPQSAAVATQDVNVRSGQSKSSRRLAVLNEGDTVALVTSGLRRGYYHVRLGDGTRGWVYSRYLRVVSGTVAPAPAAPAPSTAAAAIAGAVKPDWEKPEPATTTFSRAGFPDCGVDGQGGDALTNHRKNRTDEPSAYHTVSFDAVLKLPYPKNRIASRQDWPQHDQDVLAPYEGIPVTVTGFVAKFRGIIVEDAQNSPHGESTNCHAVDDAGVDWHVTLVRRPDDPKAKGIVVETTPRVRVAHPWTPDMLAGAVAHRDSVRISGWLLYDPEHFAQTANYDSHPVANPVRATLWEIHPITRIEVFDGQTKTWREIP